MLVRYTRWDPSRQQRLDVEKIFERLADQLYQSGSVNQALDVIVRQGFELDDGRRVTGTEELLKQLRRQIRQRQREFNLRDSLREVSEQLKSVLEKEYRALGGKHRQLAHKGGTGFERLSPKLSEAIRQLRDHQFESSEAGEEFERLLDEYENIRDLERFRERFDRLFQGPKSLGYREAVQVMREMQRLERLENELSAGNFDAVSKDDLLELLAAQDFENLRELSAELAEAGYVVEKGSVLQLSPKGVRRIGELALRDIYQKLLKDRPGAHVIDRRGIAEVHLHQGRPYTFGDPLNLDLASTFKQALSRRAELPVKLEPSDFWIFESDYATTSATVLCLDMSWSMSWEGRFAAAKKVAIALEALIRTRYPRDFFSLVGFFTRAVELKSQDLPEASWNMGDPFTNLQHALHLAASILSRHPAKNRQIVVVTDGQPTAYFRGDRLFCEWPLSFGGISVRAAQETLAEVERVTRKGITINTFMLDDSPNLRSFVDQIARINRGRAFYTRPDRLGEYIIVDYVDKKRRR